MHELSLPSCGCLSPFLMGSFASYKVLVPMRSDGLASACVLPALAAGARKPFQVQHREAFPCCLPLGLSHLGVSAAGSDPFRVPFHVGREARLRHGDADFPAPLAARAVGTCLDLLSSVTVHPGDRVFQLLCVSPVLPHGRREAPCITRRGSRGGTESFPGFCERRYDVQ